MDEKKWLKKVEYSIINQPLEGLLYDLDLMPEQCKSNFSNIVRLGITTLREEIERLKRNKDTWKAKAERLIDFNNKRVEEIERLKKENEWLLERCAEDKTKVSLYLTSEYRKLLIQEMQQALKED